MYIFPNSLYSGDGSAFCTEFKVLCSTTFVIFWTVGVLVRKSLSLSVSSSVLLVFFSSQKVSKFQTCIQSPVDSVSILEQSEALVSFLHAWKFTFPGPLVEEPSFSQCAFLKPC